MIDKEHQGNGRESETTGQGEVRQQVTAAELKLEEEGIEGNDPCRQEQDGADRGVFEIVQRRGDGIEHGRSVRAAVRRKVEREPGDPEHHPAAPDHAGAARGVGLTPDSQPRSEGPDDERKDRFL